MIISDSLYYEQAEKPQSIIKRLFDICLSLMLIIMLSPCMLIIALLIRITSEGSVIYRHKRIGLYGNEFFLYKFRTMVNNAEHLKCSFTPEQKAEFEAEFKLKNDPRVTRFGRLLRKTSLDELPQFINVFRGEMSIVGPRPITGEELVKYGKHAGTLLSVKPGITGLWQISGRNNISYEQRVQLDVEYIKRKSIQTDIKIFLRTIIVIALRLGAY